MHHREQYNLCYSPKYDHRTRAQGPLEPSFTIALFLISVAPMYNVFSAEQRPKHVQKTHRQGRNQVSRALIDVAINKSERSRVLKH